jgi:hypothetical protein
MRCRRCGADDLHLSHVRAWESPVWIATGRRPYRCHTCGRRSWLPQSAVPANRQAVPIADDAEPDAPDRPVAGAVDLAPHKH